LPRPPGPGQGAAQGPAGGGQEAPCGHLLLRADLAPDAALEAQGGRGPAQRTRPGGVRGRAGQPGHGRGRPAVLGRQRGRPARQGPAGHSQPPGVVGVQPMSESTADLTLEEYKDLVKDLEYAQWEAEAAIDDLLAGRLGPYAAVLFRSGA